MRKRSRNEIPLSSLCRRLSKRSTGSLNRELGYFSIVHIQPVSALDSKGTINICSILRHGEEKARKLEETMNR
jgi:hypothetical protein